MGTAKNDDLRLDRSVAELFAHYHFVAIQRKGGLQRKQTSCFGIRSFLLHVSP